jgi:hypothetical protein
MNEDRVVGAARNLVAKRRKVSAAPLETGKPKPKEFSIRQPGRPRSYMVRPKKPCRMPPRWYVAAPRMRMTIFAIPSSSVPTPQPL